MKKRIKAHTERFKIKYVRLSYDIKYIFKYIIMAFLAVSENTATYLNMKRSQQDLRTLRSQGNPSLVL